MSMFISMAAIRCTARIITMLRSGILIGVSAIIHAGTIIATGHSVAACISRLGMIRFIAIHLAVGLIGMHHRAIISDTTATMATTIACIGRTTQVTTFPLRPFRSKSGILNAVARTIAA